MAGHAGSTMQQLRDDIDHGRARDKVDHPDPAAVPLGADDEAAGAPLTDSDADLARFDETGRKETDAEDAGHRRQGRMGPFLLILASVAIVIASLLVLSL